MNKEFYAITINNSKVMENLTSIKSAEIWLNTFCEVYTISREINDINKNSHYHVLVKASNEILNLYSNEIWFKKLDTDIEILKYINYIKKDGKFKVIKKHEVESSDKDNWQIIALNLVQTEKSKATLFENNPNMIKYMYEIERLWKIYREGREFNGY